MRGQTGGQAKIWGGHGPPRPPLESPLHGILNRLTALLEKSMCKINLV